MSNLNIYSAYKMFIHFQVSNINDRFLYVTGAATWFHQSDVLNVVGIGIVHVPVSVVVAVPA